MSLRFLIPSVAMLFLSQAVLADTIELINGDRVQGKVSSLNQTHLIIESDILGEIKVDRSKVRAIFFGSAAPPVVQPSASIRDKDGKLPPEVQGVLNEAGSPDATKLIQNITGKAAPSTPQRRQQSEEVLRQLREQGVDAETMKQVQKTFPLLATPEAKEHFDENLQGLMTGDRSIQDIRKQAIEARNLINELKQDLGPEGAALNGYLSILNMFISETEQDFPDNSNAPQQPATSLQ